MVKITKSERSCGESIGDNTTARQKWLDDVGAVTLLMYHLTFYLIGYAESYTDYTQHHWPSAPYPLSLSAGARLNGASHD